MNLLLGLAWAAGGLLVGLAVCGWLAVRAMRQAHKAELEREQQAQALEDARENHAGLMSRMHDMSQRYERQIDVIRKTHEIEKTGLEEELRRIREKLQRIILAGETGQPMSHTAFVPTQFDDPPP